jgi:hypothetical protein
MKWTASMVALTLAVIGIAGCNNPPGTPSTPKAKPVAKYGDHSGWWCNEHGIPEEECSMCQPKVAKEFKDKGDWCKEHTRAKSQCFICDPSLKEAFAKRYRDKYGEEPPPIKE